MKVKNIVKLKNCLDCHKDRCCEFKYSEIKYAPVLTAEEVGAIKKNYKVNCFVRYKKSDDIFQIKLRKSKKGKFYICPFLNKEKLCKIHAIKPFDCQFWPFILTKSKDGKSTYICLDAEECLGFKNISKKELEKHKRYIMELFKSKKGADFLNRFYGLCWDYDPDLKVIAKMKNKKAA